MELNIKQPPQKPGEPIRWIEEAISDIANKLAAELKPILEQVLAKQPNEGEAIRKENAEVKAKLAWLEGEMQVVKDHLRELVTKQPGQSQPSNGQAKPEEQGRNEMPNQSQTAEPGQVKQDVKPNSQMAKPAKPAKPGEAQSQAKQNGQTKQAEPSQAGNGHAGQEVDEEKAEKWLLENLPEWIDQTCPFRLATGRTWRQLGENKGDKIAMNGRGLQQPRAYLHALESWQSCKPWARLKAKVALEIGKNGNRSGE